MKRIGFLLFFALLATTGCRHHDEPGPILDSAKLADSAKKGGSGQADQSSKMNAADTEVFQQLTGSVKHNTEPLIEEVPPGSPDATPPFPMKGMTKANSDSMMRARIPVGAMPILSSTRLHTLHPELPGYRKDTSRVFHRDVANIISKSVQIYRDLKDSNHTVRFEVVDQNEQAADKLIRNIADLRENDGKMISVSPEGETRVAYLTEVNGMVGTSCFIESEKVATLFLIAGDHRVIILREEPATDRQHLIELAKHFDTKKFENMH